MRFVVAVFVILFANTLAGQSAEPERMAKPSIAILDFVMQGETPAVDNWAVGLADFVAMRFQERGIATLERQDLGYVLSERRLQQSGHVETEDVIRSRLPWVRHLVKGTIANLSDSEFAINISVVDAKSTLLVARHRATGVYPDGISGTLDQLVGKIVNSIGKANLGAAPKQALPSFTKVPEIALLFYKGLDHYLNGRPEFAAEYFRQAYRNDSRFLLAAIWWMKSYEYLGLSAHVKLLRLHIPTRPGGKRLFQMLASTLVHNEGRLVVNVIPADETDADHQELVNTLTNALVATANVDVFSPEWVKGIAAEIDLEISGQFSTHPLKSQTWLTHDATLIVALLPAAAPEARSIRLQLVDNLSGEIVGQAEQAADQPEWPEASRELLRRLMKGRTGQNTSYRVFRPIEPLNYPQPNTGMTEYSVYGYAYFLRDFSEDPTNPAKIMAHYAAHTRHDSGVYRHIHKLRKRFRTLLLQALFVAIDESTPDAPKWLSHVLWRLLLNEYYVRNFFHPLRWFHGSVDVAFLEAHFAPLLDRYPASFAALCVRYAVAHTLIAAGRNEEAAALLLELAEAIPAVVPPEAGYNYLANLYFFAARAARRVGDTGSAKKYAQKALEAIDLYEKGGRKPISPVLFYVGYGPPMQLLPGHAPRWYVSGFDFTVIEDGQISFYRNQPLNEYIERLYRELRGESQAVQAERTLEELYLAIKEASGHSRIQARLAFIRKLTWDMARKRHINSGYYLFSLPKELDWLMRNSSGKELAAVQREIATLVEVLRRNRDLYGGYQQLEVDLYLKAGMGEAARAIAQEWMDSPRPFRHQGILAMTKVKRSLSPGGGAAGAFCEEQFQQYEGVIKAKGHEFGMNYMDILYACAQAYEADGQPHNSARLYRYGFEQPIFDADHRKNDLVDTQEEHRASLIFHWARMEERMGHRSQALSLYKQVLERTEGHRDWYPATSGHGGGGALPLYTQALRKIERLRRAVK